MAAVNINTGDLPSAEGKEGVDLQRVISRWQAIAAISFPENCKSLLQMIDETDRLRLWEKNIGGFSYADRDDFLRNKVLLDFDFAEQSFSEIVDRLHRGEEVRLTLRQHGGDRRSQEAREQGCNATLKRGTATYTIARLDRDKPELAQRVRDGELSANAAAIEAGFRRKPTPLETLQRAWRKASDDERAAFRDYIDTPVMDRSEKI